MRRSLPLLVFLCVPGWGQISPGTLSRAHDNLNGPTQCAACHIFGAGAPRFKCLSCHTEIRRRLATGRGFHARVVKNVSGQEDCARCHTDHFGKDFNIVKWETSASEFDHRQTGYPLLGKHAGLACNRCHNAQHVLKGERAGIRVKDLNHTYLGLSSAQCGTCHEDVHRAQLGTDCGRCHSLEGWKPASGFDHEKTRYPLTGLHQKLVCSQCHHPRTEAAKSIVQYKDIPFTSCADCHKDPHHGAFAAACHSCHATSGWKSVRTNAGFDHDKTSFPLHGAHSKTACNDCHKSSNFKEPVAHLKCADCHAPDPHQGQFPGQDCQHCHNEDVFKPSLFTVSMHQRSNYPLQGKHAAVECGKCHVPHGKDTRYKIQHELCLDCHKDAHAGQFQGARYANKCELCHTLDGFKPSTFTLARHQETQFKLAGGHAATACGECHKSPVDRFPAPPARYHFDSVACINCHQDPHQGATTSNSKQGCELCHNVRSWKETAAFDHSTTKFALLGAHRAVGCLECHRPVIGDGPTTIAFHNTPSECTGCHEDAHAGQFKRGDKTVDCLSCHSMAAWRPSVFNHEKQSNFSLKGAHEAVPCADCHTQKGIANGHAVVFYNKALKRCLDCHAKQP
ncbi:MAG TPA: cytochrome c3 family protein [Bryobacteraceae bacterium]|nr:cytochrome c3 family protein [Bryobacteraceae bacterium]